MIVQQCKVRVSASGSVVLQLPSEVAPGDYEAVLVLSAPRREGEGDGVDFGGMEMLAKPAIGTIPPEDMGYYYAALAEMGEGIDPCAGQLPEDED